MRSPGWPTFLALIGVSVLSTTAGLALAQAGSTPGPGCAGVMTTDPAGDQAGPGGAPVGPNLDITQAFFRTDNNVLTINIKVSDLTAEIPSGGAGAAWYVYWTDGAGALKYAGGNLSSDGTVAYDYGTLATNQYNSEGDTTGNLFMGKDGVVQIVIPASIAPAGKKFNTPYADTRVSYGLPVGGPRLLSRVDTAPDDSAAGGKAFTPGTCSDSASGGQTTPTPTPTATPAPAATPGGGPGGGQTTKPPVQQATPTIAVVSKSVKAKGKVVSIKVKSTGRVNGLTATLKKGKAKLGSGKLAALDGAGTVKLKLKRKPKKGSYAFAITGKDTTGKAISAKAKIRVK